MNDIGNKLLASELSLQEMGTLADPQANLQAREVSYLLNELLFKQAALALVSGFMVAVFVTVALWPVVDHWLILGWLGGLVLVTLLRGGLVVSFFKSSREPDVAERYAGYYTLGALGAGLVWSGLTVIWDATWPLAYQAVPILTLLGLSAASLTSNSPRFATFGAFAFPQLYAVTLVLLLERQQAFVNLGVLVLIFSAVVTMAARNYHQTLRRSFAHQIHSSGLLGTLQQNLSRLEREVHYREQVEEQLASLNDTLEQRVSERTEALQQEVQRHRRTQDELQRKERQNRSILNAAGEGIFGLDNSGHISFVNPAGAWLLGWEPESLVGCCADILLGDDVPGRASKSFLGGQMSRVHDGLFFGNDGKRVPVEYVSTPIIEHDEVTGAVVTFNDISSRKSAELERRKMEMQLQQAQRLETIGQLAAGIAHEVNTPSQFVGDNLRFLDGAFDELSQLLSARLQALQAASMGESPELLVQQDDEQARRVELQYLLSEIPQSIKQSLEGMGRIARIVQAMKEFSHPGTEEKVATDINRALVSTREVSRNAWKYKAELYMDLDPALPEIPAMPAELNQTFLNLIVNAVHAIEAAQGPGDGVQGRIDISTRRIGDWVRIQVRDNGCGMSESVRKRVFEPFFTTKEVGKGTGQGLALAYTYITDKHGGSIQVDSRPGEGSCFTIRLPVMVEQQND